MTLSEASLLAFTVFSGIRLVSYLPQICKVARDRNGASAISYSTWTLWTGCHLSTGLYAVINLTAQPDDVKELDRQFRINESIMRTKVIRPDTR